WRPQRPRDELSPQIPEIFDARRLDAAWILSGFDDSTWAPAAVLMTSQLGRRPTSRPPSEPFSSIGRNPLTPPTPARRAAVSVWREVPSEWPAETVGTFTATLTSMANRGGPSPTKSVNFPARASAGGTLVMDLGGIVSGTVSFRLDAAAGARVAVTLIETLEPYALDSANYLEYTARGRDDRYESLEFMGGRYLLVAVLEGDAVVTDVAVIERIRPRPQTTGFSCDDDALNWLYSVAVRTVDLCSRDAYMDCPTREQRAWVGDSIIHQSVDLTCNPNWELAIHNVRLLAQPRSDGLLPMVAAADFSSPDLVTIPDASLHWTRTVHNLYRYTGDRDLVAGLLPAFESVLRWFATYQGEDGLVGEIPGWVLIDWAPTEVDGAVASLNGLWGRALVDFAEISDWLGDGGRAEWARGLHERLRHGFEKFWDPDREVYVDSIRNGERSRRLSEHAHAAAVAGGLVPEHRFTRVAAVLLDRQHIVDPTTLLADYEPSTFFRDTLALRQQPNWDVERDLVAAQPYFRYIVHDALAALGRADAIADLLHDWDALLLTGPSALREVWRGQSYAHAWSATPARDLVKHVAGISPGSPGYDTVRIAPRPGPLSRLDVTAPSPHGVIRVVLEDEQLSVTSPRPVSVIHPDRTVTELAAGNTTLAWPQQTR
ncbi:MAG TPA: family 78 glycoside hydrolase catalytic domain, partial [Homoserinimonas sp.]|nr:family 78 glycoside hydrolase catalytic domain [Homoserinimonas sp.]